MSGIKRFAALLYLTGWLLAPETGWAGCVSRVARPACKPLAGMGTVGLVIEVQEGAAALGISRATMRETARSAIRREIPRLRVEKDTHRAPQIRISAARRGRRDGPPSL
ncbi:MAG: hypothetical protein ACE5IM_04625, partial [Nitrospinota bacterium]